eukprot:GHVL01034702.1.p1 GENE.GHVL01034702.1~~GHVL01034702.1.p1  ORF type:complete len:970 (+),score=258.83 GHVL01034702.1:212-3121(+)
MFNRNITLKLFFFQFFIFFTHNKISSNPTSRTLVPDLSSRLKWGIKKPPTQDRLQNARTLGASIINNNSNKTINDLLNWVSDDYILPIHPYCRICYEFENRSSNMNKKSVLPKAAIHTLWGCCYLSTLKQAQNIFNSTNFLQIRSPWLTHKLQETVAVAVAHSISANIVYLDQVFQNNKNISKSDIILSLVDSVDNEPLVIILRDKGECIFSDKAACQLIKNLVNQNKDKIKPIIFIMLSASRYEKLLYKNKILKTFHMNEPMISQLGQLGFNETVGDHFHCVKIVFGTEAGKPDMSIPVNRTPDQMVKPTECTLTWGVDEGKTPPLFGLTLKDWSGGGVFPPPKIMMKNIESILSQKNNGSTKRWFGKNQRNNDLERNFTKWIPGLVGEVMRGSLGSNSLGGGSLGGNSTDVETMIRKKMLEIPGIKHLTVHVYTLKSPNKTLASKMFQLKLLESILGPETVRSFLQNIKDSKNISEDNKTNNTEITEYHPDPQDSNIITVNTPEAQELLSKSIIIDIEPPRDAQMRNIWDDWVQSDLDNECSNRNLKIMKKCLNNYKCEDLSKIKKLISKVPLPENDIFFDILKSKCILFEISKNPTKMGTNVLSVESVIGALQDISNDYIINKNSNIVRCRDEVLSLANSKHETLLAHNVVTPSDICISFNDIGGLDDVKELLRECITYPLRYPELYDRGLTQESTKGVLLFGPPGTGKTMLAKAVATEGGATFLCVDAGTIQNMWLGESEKTAKAVFSLARKMAPCVVFIDEIDALLSSRDTGGDTSHGTVTSLKTTLMSEWDGLSTSKDRVIVMGSTNRPYVLDEAVLRRMPRRVLVDLPDLYSRCDIIKKSLKDHQIQSDVNITSLALDMEGYTGSDVKEVCRRAVTRIANSIASQSFKNDTYIDSFRDELKMKPLTNDDFNFALKKVTSSISSSSLEISQIWRWNEEYGEIARKRENDKSRKKFPKGITTRV